MATSAVLRSSFLATVPPPAPSLLTQLMERQQACTAPLPSSPPQTPACVGGTLQSASTSCCSLVRPLNTCSGAGPSQTLMPLRVVPADSAAPAPGSPPVWPSAALLLFLPGCLTLCPCSSPHQLHTGCVLLLGLLAAPCWGSSRPCWASGPSAASILPLPLLLLLAVSGAPVRPVTAVPPAAP